MEFLVIGILVIIAVALWLSHKSNKKNDGPRSGGKPEGPRK